MASKPDWARIQEELVQEFKYGNEAQARALVAQLGSEPRQVRARLEAMLENPDSFVRQAAAFGLGELGGTASAKRLEQQLAIEEARGDYDGEAVVEDITRALGRIEEASARAALIRRLDRLAAGKPERSDVTALARALWRRRHSELIPAVKRSLETVSLPAPHSMHGLLVLLEMSPEELDAWARNPAVPITHKTRALVVLEEEVPDTLIPVLPGFIATAASLLELDVSQDREAAHYFERLFSLLLMDPERFLKALPEEPRATLRAVARRLVAAAPMGCALPSAVVLKLIGRPEDAGLLVSHRPADPSFAQIFDDAAQALRNLH